MLTGKIYSVTHEFIYVATLVNDSVIKSKRLEIIMSNSQQTTQTTQEAQPSQAQPSGAYFKLWVKDRYVIMQGSDSEAAKASRDNQTTALCYNAKGYYTGGFDKGWAAF